MGLKSTFWRSGGEDSRWCRKAPQEGAFWGEPRQVGNNPESGLTVAYKLLTWDGDIAGMKRGLIPALEPVETGGRARSVEPTVWGFEAVG
jgi:hypothetical protein